MPIISGKKQRSRQRVIITVGVIYLSPLKCIDCYENQLSALDISDCTVLEELDFQGNPLQTLTISASQQNAEWLNEVREKYPDIEIIVK